MFGLAYVFAVAWHFAVGVVACWVYWMTRTDQRQSQDMIGFILLDKIVTDVVNCLYTTFYAAVDVVGTVASMLYSHWILFIVFGSVFAVAVFQETSPASTSEAAQAVYGGVVQGILHGTLNDYVFWPVRVVLEPLVLSLNLVVEVTSQFLFGVALTVGKCSSQHFWDIAKTVPRIGAGMAGAFTEWLGSPEFVDTALNTTRFVAPMQDAAIYAENGLLCACQSTGFLVQALVAVARSNHTAQAVFHGTNVFASMTQQVRAALPPYSRVPKAKPVGEHLAGFLFHTGGMSDDFAVGMWSGMSMGVVYTYDQVVQSKYKTEPMTFQRVYKDVELDAFSERVPKEFVFASSARLAAAGIEAVTIAIDGVMHVFAGILTWDLTSIDLYNLADASNVWRNLYLWAYDVGSILSWFINGVTHVLHYAIDSKPYSNFVTGQTYQCNYDYSLDVTKTLQEACTCQANVTCGPHGQCAPDGKSCVCAAGYMHEHPDDAMSPCTVQHCHVVDTATSNLLQAWQSGNRSGTSAYLATYRDPYVRVHTECLHQYTGMLYDHCVHQAWKVYRAERVERPGTREVRTDEELALLHPDFMLAAALGNASFSGTVAETARQFVRRNADVVLYQWFTKTEAWRTVGMHPDVRSLQRTAFTDADIAALKKAFQGFQPSDPAAHRTFSRVMLPYGLLQHAQLAEIVGAVLAVPASAAVAKPVPQVSARLGFCGRQCRVGGMLVECSRSTCSAQTGRCTCSTEDQTRMNVTTGMCQQVRHILGANTYTSRCKTQRDTVQDALDAVPCTVAALLRLPTGIMHVAYDFGRSVLFRTVYAHLLNEYSNNILRTMQSYDGMWFPRDKTLSCALRSTLPDAGTDRSLCDCDLRLGQYSHLPNMWCDKPTLQASVFHEMDMVAFYAGATTPVFEDKYINLGSFINVPGLSSQPLTYLSWIFRPGRGITGFHGNATVSVGAVGTATVRVLTELARVSVRTMLSADTAVSSLNGAVTWFDLPIDCMYGLPAYTTVPPIEMHDDLAFMQDTIRQYAGAYMALTETQYDTMGILERTPSEATYVQTWFLQDRIVKDVDFMSCGMVEYDKNTGKVAPKCRQSTNYRKNIYTAYKPWLDSVDPRLYETSGSWCNSLMFEWLFYHLDDMAAGIEKIVALTGDWDDLDCTSQRATYSITNSTAASFFDETTFGDLTEDDMNVIAEMEIAKRLGSTQSTAFYINRTSDDYDEFMSGRLGDLTTPADAPLHDLVVEVYRKMAVSNIAPSKKAFTTCEVYGKHNIGCALGYTGNQMVRGMIELGRTVSLATMDILRLKPNMDSMLVFPHVCNYERILGAASSVVSSFLFTESLYVSGDAKAVAERDINVFGPLRVASARIFFTILDLFSTLPYVGKNIQEAYPKLDTLQTIGGTFVALGDTLRGEILGDAVQTGSDQEKAAARRIADATLQKFVQTYGTFTMDDIIRDGSVSPKVKNAIAAVTHLAKKEDDKKFEEQKAMTDSYKTDGLQNTSQANFRILAHTPAVKAMSNRLHERVLRPAAQWMARKAAAPFKFVGNRVLVRPLRRTLSEFPLAFYQKKADAAADSLKKAQATQTLLRQQLAVASTIDDRMDLRARIERMDYDIRAKQASVDRYASTVRAKKSSIAAMNAAFELDDRRLRYRAERFRQNLKDKMRMGRTVDDATKYAERQRMSQVATSLQSAEINSKRLDDIADVDELDRRAKVDLEHRHKTVLTKYDMNVAAAGKSNSQQRQQSLDTAKTQLDNSQKAADKTAKARTQIMTENIPENRAGHLKVASDALPDSNVVNKNLKQKYKEDMISSLKSVKQRTKHRAIMTARNTASKVKKLASREMGKKYLSFLKDNVYAFTSGLRTLGGIIKIADSDVGDDNVFDRMADLIQLVYFSVKEYVLGIGQILVQFFMNLLMAFIKWDTEAMGNALIDVIRGMAMFARLVAVNIMQFISGVLGMLGVFGKALMYIIGPICHIVQFVLDTINSIPFVSLNMPDMKCPQIGGRRLQTEMPSGHTLDMLNLSWTGTSYCDLFMHSAIRHSIPIEELVKRPSDAAGVVDCLHRRVLGETVHYALQDVGVRTFPVSFFYDPWTAAGWSLNVTKGVVLWATHSIPALVGQHHVLFDRMDEDAPRLGIDVATTRSVVYAVSRLLGRAWNGLSDASRQAMSEWLRQTDPEYDMPNATSLTAQLYQLHAKGREVSKMIADADVDLPKTLSDAAAGVHVLGGLVVTSARSRVGAVLQSFPVQTPAEQQSAEVQEDIADYAPQFRADAGPSLQLVTHSTCSADQRQHATCLGCALVDNLIWDMYKWTNYTKHFFTDPCNGHNATVREHMALDTKVENWFDHNGSLTTAERRCSARYDDRPLEYPEDDEIRVVRDTTFGETVQQFLTETGNAYVPYFGHSLWYWIVNTFTQCRVETVFCQGRRAFGTGLSWALLVYAVLSAFVRHAGVPRGKWLARVAAWSVFTLMAYGMSPLCFPRIPTCVLADAHHLLTSMRPCLCMYFPTLGHCTEGSCRDWKHPQPFTTTCVSGLGWFWNVPFYVRWQHPQAMVNLSATTVRPVQTILSVPGMSKMVRDSRNIPFDVHPRDVDCWWWTLPRLVSTVVLGLTLLWPACLIVAAVCRSLVALGQTVVSSGRFGQHTLNGETNEGV